jgi:hypothetical protein
MLAALTWTHPVHGVVTERLCPVHELPARQAFTELGIEYTARLVFEGRCHRCDGRRPWQGQRRPDAPADQAPASPELGITYSARLVAEGPCHRCQGRRLWQGRPDTSSEAATGPGGERPAAGFGWFKTVPLAGAGCDAEGHRAPPPGALHTRPCASRRRRGCGAMSTLSEAVVCAAVDRACRHDLGDDVIAEYVADELAADEPTSGASGDAVRARLVELAERGLVKRVGENCSRLWALTPAGAQLVPDGAPLLPESRQHRDWRRARENAATNLEGLRVGLTRELAQIEAMLTEETLPSPAWMEAARRIRHLTYGMSVAMHVLHERPEPTDDRPAHAFVEVRGPADWSLFQYELDPRT